MVELTETGKETVKEIIEDIFYQDGILAGTYDATKDTEKFMNGIQTAITYLATLVNEDYAVEVEKKIEENILISQNMAKCRICRKVWECQSIEMGMTPCKNFEKIY